MGARRSHRDHSGSCGFTRASIDDRQDYSRSYCSPGSFGFAWDLSGAPICRGDSLGSVGFIRAPRCLLGLRGITRALVVVSGFIWENLGLLGNV